MDPTLLAILSIFGGAALTTVAGFIGAGIQSRREHEKWLREKRLEAFVESRVYFTKARRLVDDYREASAKAKNGDALAGKKMEQLVIERNEVAKEYARAAAPLAVLGPDEIDEAITKLAKQLFTDDEIAKKAADEVVIGRMRAALKIQAPKRNRESK